jgi:hypothetical protein
MKSEFEKARDEACRKFFDAKYPATCRTPSGKEWTFEQSHSLQLCREMANWAYEWCLNNPSSLSKEVLKMKITDAIAMSDNLADTMARCLDAIAQQGQLTQPLDLMDTTIKEYKIWKDSLDQKRLKNC